MGDGADATGRTGDPTADAMLARAGRLRADGRTSEAVDACGKAAVRCRVLAARDRDRHRPALVAMLHALAGELARVGSAEADAVAREARRLDTGPSRCVVVIDARPQGPTDASVGSQRFTHFLHAPVVAIPRVMALGFTGRAVARHVRGRALDQ